jgi:hypothetical protein
MQQRDAEWFRPLWRRVAVTALVAVWLGYEAIFSHELLWMAISGAALAYCIWNFFLTFPRAAPPPPSSPPPPPSPPEGPSAG